MKEITLVTKEALDITKEVAQAVQEEVKQALSTLGVDFSKGFIDAQNDFLGIRMVSELFDTANGLPGDSRLLVYKKEKLEYIIWIKHVLLNNVHTIRVETDIQPTSNIKL